MPMLDKEKIKEKLEKEKDTLLEQLRDVGKFDPETNEWEAVPEETESNESDANDQADRFEDFEERTAMVLTLKARLDDIDAALGNLNKDFFGKCEVCGKDVEQARLEVNPAARTCKKHLEK